VARRELLQDAKAVERPTEPVVDDLNPHLEGVLFVLAGIVVLVPEIVIGYLVLKWLDVIS